MAKETFEIKLADGTRIGNLTLNGNNFISVQEVTPETFEDNLDVVEIKNVTADTVQILRDCVLVQIVQDIDGYWFVLAEKSADQKMADDIEAQAQAIMELAEIIGDLA